MVGEIEMDYMNGVCKGCGQVIIVEAADQQDADIKATDRCGCHESRLIKNRVRIRNTITDLCGEAAEERGFQWLDTELTELIINLAELTQLGRVESAQLRAGDSVIKIRTNADGMLLFSRNRSETIEEEI